MTTFSVKTTDYQKNLMLNICDPELLDKELIQDQLKIQISRSYYGQKLVDKDEAITLLKNSSIINMAGKETVSLSISLGIGSENGVRIIDGVPFLIVFKM